MAVMGLVILAGCGFQPLYGRTAIVPGKEPAGALLRQVAIKPIPDREGQQLRNALLDRITPQGAPKNPTYELSVKLTESIQGLAVQRTAFATRANLILRARVVLSNLETGKTVFSSNDQAISSYNILNSEFATLMSERNARQSAVNQLSDQIKTRVAVQLLSRSDGEDAD